MLLWQILFNLGGSILDPWCVTFRPLMSQMPFIDANRIQTALLGVPGERNARGLWKQLGSCTGSNPSSPMIFFFFFIAVRRDFTLLPISMMEHWTKKSLGLNYIVTWLNCTAWRGLGELHQKKKKNIYSAGTLRAAIKARYLPLPLMTGFPV